jgi:hypothetical protein
MTRSMFLVIILLSSAVFGAPAPSQTPAEKFAPQIKNYTDSANYEKEALGQMLAQAQDIADLAKPDFKLVTAYMENAASLWSSAAATLEKGDEPAATALAKKAQGLDKNRDIWNQRLSWRRGQLQREYLPASEEIFNMLVGDRKPGEVLEIEAFIEAKKRRSEAYGRLADAALPGADPHELAHMQDEVDALDVEVQVADLKRNWAEQDRMYRLYVATDPKITSSALTAAQQQLTQWRQKYEEAYRRSREAEHALELQKRQANEISEARTTAYKEAKAAQEAAQKQKK